MHIPDRVAGGPHLGHAVPQLFLLEDSIYGDKTCGNMNEEEAVDTKLMEVDPFELGNEEWCGLASTWRSTEVAQVMHRLQLEVRGQSLRIGLLETENARRIHDRHIMEQLCLPVPG